MAVVRRLLEWEFINYEEESNVGDGTETYSATGELKVVGGCTERIVEVFSGGFNTNNIRNT